MNRYRITSKQILGAKKFLKDGKTRGVAAWATKFKDQLSTKGGKLYFDDKLIIPRDGVEDYLRKRLYDKNGDLQQSRDSAHYQLLKTTVGVTRRTIMEFLKSQRTLGETRPQVTKPKSKGGPKLKSIKKGGKNIFETDLVFITKSDLEKQNPRFTRKMKENLTYALCTTDKITGLTRLTHVKTKAPAVVSPKVIEHVKWLAGKLKIPLDKCQINSDAGDEFNHALFKTVVGDSKQVSTGVSVERKNQQFQRYFYTSLKNRTAITVANALKKAENLVNNCYSRIQKKTPLESCEEKQEDNRKQYNTKRSTYVTTDTRKELNVGDHVRVLERDEKKDNIGYKSYKNITWSKKVYVITNKTKKQPIKYRVKIGLRGKYLTIDKLLKTNKRDQKSEELIVKRDTEIDAVDKKENDKVAKALADARKKLSEKHKKGSAKAKQIEQLQARRKKQEAIDKQLEEQEKAEEKAAGHKLKGPKFRNVNKPAKEEAYNPKAKRAKPKPKPKPKINQKEKTKLIRTFLRLRTKYQRFMKKDELTDAQKATKATTRSNGRDVVKRINEAGFRNNLDLDIFNEV